MFLSLPTLCGIDAIENKIATNRFATVATTITSIEAATLKASAHVPSIVQLGEETRGEFILPRDCSPA